jgi:hypothetical protein
MQSSPVCVENGEIKYLLQARLFILLNKRLREWQCPFSLRLKYYRLMILFIAGKIVIGIQIILLLVWVYSLFGSPNGTDPAGQGTAFTLLIGFASYIAVGVFLLLTKRTWPMISVLIMAAIPITIVVSMWIKEWQNRER